MSHFAALAYEGSKQVQLISYSGSLLPELRTRLVAQGYAMDATHIMWFDSDMKFPPDIITRLLNHNLAVVAVNYPQKNMAATPTAYVDDEDYTGRVWSGDNATGLKRVAVAGMGAMLVDMKVFDKIGAPFFQITPIPPDFIKQSGEDVFFCKKLHDAMIPVHIDHDLSKEVAHLGMFEYTNQFSATSEATKQELYRMLPDRKLPT